jgi:hypothetical protein
MSVIPQVRQVRRQISMPDGSVQFEVASQVTDPGDLPFPHLFVMTITDPASPKDDVLARIATPVDVRQATTTALYVKVLGTDLITISGDTFARIANVNDLTQLPRDRVVAVRLGLTSYLSTAITLIYDNVTTADAAAKQVVDRLSTLVSAWRTFNTTFITNPYQVYSLPQPATGVIAERTAVYVTARTARITAETARDAAQEAKDACVRDCAADKIVYDYLVYDVAFLQTARALVDAQPVSTTRTFVLGSDAASYQALLTKKQADLSVYAEKVRACASNCASLAAALLTAQQAVDAARTAEQAALANVIAVCPTFDPSTV